MAFAQDIPNSAIPSDDPCPDTYNPIAICGMALRLPGGITNPSQFWDFLIAKGDARSRVPQTRYNISSYYSKSERYGTSKTEYGYFLDESIDLGALDTSFFSFTKSELEYIDPQQRQLLEVVRECFESAGEVNYRGKHIGCYVGSFGDDWVENLFHDLQMYGKYTLMTGGDFALSNRTSYEYDLRGPSMSIRTACSSSIVCLHEACLAIERGICSAAIVAGCNLIMSPTMTMILSAKGVISPDGSCKTFDAEANGYGRAEAINAIYIKPLKDALRDGNPIRAVIRATAVNNDGKTSGANAPSVIAQEDLIRKAYLAAGIDDVSQTAFVECHGTGTAVGDPVEAMGVANTFGGKGVYIGSVKPNIGHSEGASGLTSLIKTVLALEHQIIPPNIKFNTPNPKIPFAAKNLKVPIESVRWPQDRCLRASVNCFGMGGTNAHAILESAKNFTPPRSPRTKENTLVPHLLVFSANSVDSLEVLVYENHKYLQEHPSALKDLTYTLGARREHLAFRATSIIDRKLSITASSFVKSPSTPPGIVMVFTGQGAQWPGMGARLYEAYWIFRRSILQLEEVLQKLPEAPDWRISDEMMNDEDRSNLHKASYSQPICTAIQIALVDLLRGLAISPYAVVGHSSGELAAAYAAGRLTASEALTSAFYRGLVSEQVAESGGMAAVGMGKDSVTRLLVPGVVIACENSPSSVTISGNLDGLEKVIQAISASWPEVLIRRLHVDVAYHSHHMRSVGETYRSLLDRVLSISVCLNSSSVHFFSSVTGERLGEGDTVGSRYWQSNLESPVLFHTALKALLAQSNRHLLLLEVGPHSALSSPIRQTIDQASRSDQYIPCLTRHKDSAESFLSAVGQLYCQNTVIDFNALTNADNDAKVLTDMPTYCWNHSYSSLYEPRENKEWRWCKNPKHELLGIRVIDSTDNAPYWRNVLHVEHVPWLRDHKVGGAVVFPAAGYISMVGAALQQLASIKGGFRVRNMVLSTAMILSDLKSTEILTSLRRRHQGGWYDFIISAHNGVAWTEHCHGQAQRSNDLVADQCSDRQQLCRRVNSPSWYETLRRGGLEYGSTFQCVDDLFCSTTEQIASGKIVPTIDENVYYPIHPIRLDGFFQTVLAAMYNGLDWHVGQPRVPTKIDELDICDCQSDLTARTWVTASKKAMTSADGEVYDSDGGMVVRLKGAMLRSVAGQIPMGNQESQNAARLHWQPDIQFLRLADLVTSPPGWKEQTDLLSCATSLCISQALFRLREQGVSSKIPHLRKYQDWLLKQPSCDCKSDFESVIGKLAATPAKPCANALLKVLENIVPICEGGIEPLEILMSDDTLLQLYNYLNLGDRTALFKSLSHHQPKQRILEIGAGTGGTTAKILPHAMYSTYAFTDISTAFFPAAKDRFKAYHNILFKALDIEKDPLNQGFEEASFDLIVAANVLHATSSLHKTLVHVRKLLRPQGKLLLEELCPETKFTNFVTGILPGWWGGDKDGRFDEPYVSPKRWEQELKNAGFNGLDDFAFDATPPYHLNGYMLASPYVSKVASGKSTVLVCDTISADIAVQFQAILRSRGFSVNVQGLQDPLTEAQDVIALVDVVSPFFHCMDMAKLSAFQSFLHQLQQSRSGALWVTRPCQLNCEDPRFALAIGVARTTRSETGIDFATCEVDTIKHTSICLVIDVFEKFHSRINKDIVLVEKEYAITNGMIHIARMLPFSLQKELCILGMSDCESKGQTLTLDMGTSGVLDTLLWKASAKRQGLKDDEVEIEVDVAGVNFKDLLMALRTIEPQDERLGLEAAGVVRRVGCQVQDLSPGDRAFIIGPGSFASSIIVSAARCARIPNCLPIEDAATMPVVFATVIYSLIDVAQLKAKQTILIHSACGGVGIAAIQIGQMIGATLYATVGNEEKVQYLMENYGIPRDRIFNSHDSSFLTGVMTATGGRGVDVVLNSLSGDLFDHSCRCVAECGKMLNLTKRDAAEDAQMSLNLFKSNISYNTIDITDYIQLNPREGKRLLRTIVELYEQCHIRPIVPVKSFSADAVKDCFRYMQGGQHIGKLRVILYDRESPLKPMFLPKTVTFEEDASYLLVGGLGGLGHGLARWMVEQNTRHLIFLSRSAGDGDSDKLFFQELESQGCSVTAVKGSVCELSDVKQAISSAPAPLKGIFNISMVLRDESLLKMSLEEWNAATGPKVHGTWNLHEASLNYALDFFVLFSSMCGIIGMPGQGNYAAANTFMDGFVQYRHRCQLPASVLDLGAIEGIGHVANNPRVLERSKWLDYARMSQKELFDAITVAICNGLPPQQNAGLRDTNSAQVIGGFRNTANSPEVFSSKEFFFDSRLSTYTAYVTEHTAVNKPESANKLAQFVALAATNREILTQESASEFLAKEIAAWVFDLLMKPVEDESEIDTSRSLSDVGLDSLAAVEMRSWWKMAFGLEISTLEIMSFPSFAALGEHVHQGLIEKCWSAERGQVAAS